MDTEFWSIHITLFHLKFMGQHSSLVACGRWMPLVLASVSPGWMIWVVCLGADRSCNALGDREQLESMEWGFEFCCLWLLSTKPGVSSMLVAVASVCCNREVTVWGLCFVVVKYFSHVKTGLLRFINLAKYGIFSVTESHVLGQLVSVTCCRHAELCW